MVKYRKGWKSRHRETFGAPSVEEISIRLATEAQVPPTREALRAAIDGPTVPITTIVEGGTLHPDYTSPEWDVAHGAFPDWSQQLPSGGAVAR